MAKKKTPPRSVLAPATLLRLKQAFAPEDRAAAARLLLARCGQNLPFCEDASPTELDRLRIAAIKVSRGKLDRLRWAVRMAEEDWRDLLLTAGFEDDLKAHRKWVPRRRRG